MGIVSELIRKNGPEVYALVKGGLPGFVAARRPPKDLEGIPAFCYHQADRDQFKRDMLFLVENGYQTVSADDMLDHLKGRRVLPPKSVVLTFDDGAVNFYRVAFPLLKRHNHRAVFFIAPGLHDEAANATRAEDRPCTWEELSEMHESGMVDIQSHTWSHRVLDGRPGTIGPTGISAGLVADRMRNDLSVDDELRMARESIETRFNKKVKHLAWPCFVSSESALRIAVAVGYEAFWTGVLPGRPLNMPGQSPHEIVRLSGEFLRRLPGDGRRPLVRILCRRYFEAARKRL